MCGSSPQIRYVTPKRALLDPCQYARPLSNGASLNNPGTCFRDLDIFMPSTIATRSVDINVARTNFVFHLYTRRVLLQRRLSS